jgi:alanine dehydrogenase
MLVLSGHEIRRLLDLDALIDALAAAMAELSAGQASAPDRIAAFVPEHDGLLAAMPGYVPSRAALVSKLVTLYPRNAGTDIPTHQATIAMFDPRTGSPTALLDGTEITTVRTGAASALSVRLLAREDAAVLAIVGTGVQARSHARAVVRVRSISEIRIAGRDPRQAGALARDLAEELGLPVRAAGSYADALNGADIVCAATHASEPVVRREWLAPGAHVTSAGSNDLTQPIRDGLISPEHIHAELGELVSGTRPGRTSDEQITLYKSVGVAVQDAAAAALVLAKARDIGAGLEVAL